MRAIEALEIVNREGTDNSEYGIVREWGKMLNDEVELRSVASLVCELFGKSAEIIERSYGIHQIFQIEAMLYVYRDEDGKHDFVGEVPVMTVYDHEFKSTIDLYRLS